MFFTGNIIKVSHYLVNTIDGECEHEGIPAISKKILMMKGGRYYKHNHKLILPFMIKSLSYKYSISAERFIYNCYPLPILI